LLSVTTRRATGLGIGWCLGLIIALSAAEPAAAAKTWKVGGLLYASRTVDVAPGEERAGTIHCGSTEIISGGVAVPGPSGRMRVNGLVPDEGNNAWFSYVDGFGTRERSFKSFAICSKGTFNHVDQDYFPINAGQVGTGVAICGAGEEVVGGGEAPPVGYGDARVIESSSESSTSWRFTWRNTDDGSHSFDVHATCKQGWDLRRAVATEKLKARKLGGATAACRRHEHVVGGGAAVTSDDVAYLTASRPLDDGDKGKAPDDGWRAVLDSASATPADIEALAICRS
jgi:hypothetical protein